MTAWLAIALPLGIIAQCAIDFIGMEYGSEHQYMTDATANFVMGCAGVIAMLTDLGNSIRNRPRG